MPGLSLVYEVASSLGLLHGPALTWLVCEVAPNMGAALWPPMLVCKLAPLYLDARPSMEPKRIHDSG